VGTKAAYVKYIIAFDKLSMRAIVVIDHINKPHPEPVEG
jgi:hypothetical protein